MGEKIKDRYRIESSRMQNWDYGRNGKYFITICTGGRECFFGNIEDRNVKLSQIGILADKFWIEIPNHFEYVILDQYIIMPNHVHGILEIRNGRNAINRRDAINRVSTSTNTENLLDTNRQTGGITGLNNPMLNDNLSRVIRWYKGRVSFETNKFQKDFHWQTRFNDSIVRDQKSLDNIRNYITNNPGNLAKDELNPYN